MSLAQSLTESLRAHSARSQLLLANTPKQTVSVVDPRGIIHRTREVREAELSQAYAMQRA